MALQSVQLSAKLVLGRCVPSLQRQVKVPQEPSSIHGLPCHPSPSAIRPPRRRLPRTTMPQRRHYAKEVQSSISTFCGRCPMELKGILPASLRGTQCNPFLRAPVVDHAAPPKCPTARHESVLPAAPTAATSGRRAKPARSRGRDHFNAGEGFRPLRLAAEPQPQKQPVVVTPMRPIIPQHVAVVEDLDLPNGVLVIADFDVPDKFAPSSRDKVFALCNSPAP